MDHTFPHWNGALRVSPNFGQNHMGMQSTCVRQSKTTYLKSSGGSLPWRDLPQEVYFPPRADTRIQWGSSWGAEGPKMKNPPGLHRSVAIPAPPRLRWVWGSRKAVTARGSATGQKSVVTHDISCYEVSCPEKSEQFWGEPQKKWGEPQKKPSRAKGEDWLTGIMTSAKWSLNTNRHFRWRTCFLPRCQRSMKNHMRQNISDPQDGLMNALIHCGFFQPNGDFRWFGGPHSDMVRSPHPTLWRIWIIMDHHGSPCLYAIDIH